MKRLQESVLGVTLLEIMLVLAVAAMIVVMSVRYYQSANASQQANSALQQIQAVVASADALSQASGSYANVSTEAVRPLLANVGGLSLPWGGQITIASPTATGYSAKLSDVPTYVCPLIQARLTDTHFSSVECSNGELTFNYIANPS